MRIAPLLRLFLLIVLAGCGAVNTITPAAAIQISLRLDPDPPTVGESMIIITLADDAGSPIDGATLTVLGDMEHEGMAMVNRQVSESTNGEYSVPFEWSMGGAWVITVTAVLPNNGGETVKTFETFVEAISSESIIRQTTPTP